MIELDSPRPQSDFVPSEKWNIKVHLIVRHSLSAYTLGKRRRSKYKHTCVHLEALAEKDAAHGTEDLDRFLVSCGSLIGQQSSVMWDTCGARAGAV